MSASANSFILPDVKIYRAKTANSVVTVVITVRPKISVCERSNSSVNFVTLTVFIFSRTRSNTTIVSFIE